MISMTRWNHDKLPGTIGSECIEMLLIFSCRRFISTNARCNGLNGFFLVINLYKWSKAMVEGGIVVVYKRGSNQSMTDQTWIQPINDCKER
jgi:hypothetical protein